MPHPRSKAAAATGADGNIYLFCDRSNGFTAIDVYNPLANTWATVDAGGNTDYPFGLPYTSFGCEAVAAGPVIYLMMGISDGGLGTPTGELYAFDPRTWMLSYVSSELAPKTNAAGLAAGLDGTLYLLAGYAYMPGTLGGPTNDMQLYGDAGGDAGAEWFVGPPLPAAVDTLAGVADTNGAIYAIGGVGGAGTPLATTYRYVPDAGWDAGPPLLDDLSGLGAALGADGLIYALGGQPDAGPYIDAQSYRPGAASWSRVGNGDLPNPRWAVAVASALDGGRIFVFGGFKVGTPANAQSTVDAWDIPDAGWLTSAP